MPSNSARIDWADDDHLMMATSATTLPMGLIGKVHEWYLLNVWDIAKEKMTNYPDPDQNKDVRIDERALW